MMKRPVEAGHEAWDRGWDEHKTRQLRRLSELPFADKLDWLEEAQVLGEQLIAQTNRNKTTEQ